MTGKHRQLAPPSVLQLIRQFGLTTSEAEIVRSLALGQTPQAIAATRAVSIHTVRTQLKRILLKMGEHTQAAVVARVYTQGVD